MYFICSHKINVVMKHSKILVSRKQVYSPYRYDKTVSAYYWESQQEPLRLNILITHSCATIPPYIVFYTDLILNWLAKLPNPFHVFWPSDLRVLKDVLSMRLSEFNPLLSLHPTSGDHDLRKLKFNPPGGASCFRFSDRMV